MSNLDSALWPNLYQVDAQDGPKTAQVGAISPHEGPKAPQDSPRTQKSSQNGSKFAPKSVPNLIKCQNGLKAKNEYFSYINFILFYLLEASFSMPKTVEKPQQKQISLVEALFCVGMTLRSGQDAAKMRQDGPDDTTKPIKMEHQLAQKAIEKRMKKECRKILVTRKTGRESTMQAQRPGPPTPSILASPGKIPLISLKYQASSSEVNLLRFRPPSLTNARPICVRRVLLISICGVFAPEPSP